LNARKEIGGCSEFLKARKREIPIRTLIQGGAEIEEITTTTEEIRKRERKRLKRGMRKFLSKAVQKPGGY